MVNTLLMLAACACLMGALAWEIAKALSAPATERWRRREANRQGFPVIFLRRDEKDRNGDGG